MWVDACWRSDAPFGGAPGETVTVAVKAGDGVVRVEVTDRSGPGVPEVYSAARDSEGGRGLQVGGLQDGPPAADDKGGRVVLVAEDPAAALVLAALPGAGHLGVTEP